ncbi:MAG: hypothetical protein HKO02_01615 [Hyphomonadaceae bacterium]|nr:hypothetical protein [Hyphomonadaceae bacterium]
MNPFVHPYFLGGVALMAFGAGWSVNDWRHDAKMQKAADKARAESQLKLDALRVSLDEANSERLSLAADLASEKANIKIKYRTMTQEVPAHAPTNSDICNYDLSPGLIGLLNTAARGGTGYPRGSAQPAGQRIGTVPGSAADAAD